MVLTAGRIVKNAASPVKRFAATSRLTDQPIIAFSESDLWNPSDNKENWMLTAGKVENLRIAARRLNGTEVRANEVFSFWRHIGNPNFRQGYVVGREIREGCIVPTVAGGLCQLSNALYDAALKANFEIVERHRHTKVIQGSLAEQDRDATVKWNYVDLRFKSTVEFRIEAELTSDKLIVRFKGQHKSVPPADQYRHRLVSDKLNDCYSCGNFGCFKHPNRSAEKQPHATTAFVLDERWDEFDAYVHATASEGDHVILPLKKNAFVTASRYDWKSIAPYKTSATTLQGLYRALRLRLASKQQNVFALSLRLDRRIARAAARKIPVEATHLVIAQHLLLFIYETGALGGRTFDVLMTRLPMEKLHERLDFAHMLHPESPTLRDFRAPAELIKLENKALTKARKIITPHAEVAAIFNHKAVKLNWQLPVPTGKQAGKGKKVLFPASAVGRKGAYEIRQLAQELNIELAVAGRAIENTDFWGDVTVEPFNGHFDEIGLVVYPAYVEHQPRQLLKAIANGIPVITTTACGLDPSANVHVVELGNVEQLKEKVRVFCR